MGMRPIDFAVDFELEQQHTFRMRRIPGFISDIYEIYVDENRIVQARMSGFDLKVHSQNFVLDDRSCEIRWQQGRGGDPKYVALLGEGDVRGSLCGRESTEVRSPSPSPLGSQPRSWSESSCMRRPRQAGEAVSKVSVPRSFASRQSKWKRFRDSTHTGEQDSRANTHDLRAAFSRGLDLGKHHVCHPRAIGTETDVGLEPPGGRDDHEQRRGRARRQGW